MSIYIGNDLEDRLEALEAKNASLRKYNKYHQVVHEIDHMSDLHVDSSFYKQGKKLVEYNRRSFYKQGKKLVEYNRRKKEELKRLNEHITKQDNIAEYKPRTDSNNYVYAGGLSVLGLAIGGYLLYGKFKKPERKLIDVPALPVVKTNTESKRDIFEML